MQQANTKTTKSRIPDFWKIVPGGIQRPGCTNGWIVIDASEGYASRKVIVSNKGRGYSSYQAALKAAYYYYNKEAYAVEEKQFIDFLSEHKDFRDALTEKQLFRSGYMITIEDVSNARQETSTTLPWTDKKFLKLYSQRDIKKKQK